MGRSWAGKMGRSAAGLGAMEIWAWVSEVKEERKKFKG